MCIPGELGRVEVYEGQRAETALSRRKAATCDVAETVSDVDLGVYMSADVRKVLLSLRALMARLTETGMGWDGKTVTDGGETWQLLLRLCGCL